MYLFKKIKMKRDNKGRYVKAENDGYNINLYIPSLKILMYWILFITVIFPWIVIGAKFELMKKIFEFFGKIMQSPLDDTSETPKKNGLFY